MSASPPIPEGSVNFRKALPEDLPLLMHWAQQPHLAGTGADEDWEFEESLRENPTWREQLIAELDGTPMGFVQIIDPKEEESHYWGEVEENLRAIDIWIGEERFVGKGYGSAMMRLAIGRCFADPAVRGILIDPLATNEKAIRFYERLGFEFLEARVMDGSEVRVYRLARE
jgi:aminoglycoside 6'-N-acetyltransferase